MNANESSKEAASINQEQLKKIMARAYMKGENLHDINAKELINDLVKELKNFEV